MSQTCSKCNKVVKAFQRLLVYEPMKEPCKTCDRPRPYPSAPPFGTTIKVCSFGEMERMCFPKLCDCPCREIPLCPDAQRREKICRAIYWLATFALLAYLFDSGIFRHPVHTTRLTERVQDMLAELFTKEDDGNEQNQAATDDKENQKAVKQRDPKREYDKATKTYNVRNLWNTAVIGTGDVLITLIKLPKFILMKTMDAICTMNEDDSNKNENTKNMSNKKKEDENHEAKN